MMRFCFIKKLTLILGILFITIASQAQFTTGGRIGANLADLRGTSVENHSMIAGYNVGGFVNFNMEDQLSGNIADILSFQAELTVQTKGTKSDFIFLQPNPSDSTFTDTTLKTGIVQNFTYVQVPVLARFTFPTSRRSDFSIFAEGGIYAAALFGLTVDGEKSRDNDYDKRTDRRKFREEYSGFDFGVTVGAGAGYRLPFGGRKRPFTGFINLRYSLGLNNIGQYKKKTLDIPESSLENIMTNTISIMVGIAYKLKKIERE